MNVFLFGPLCDAGLRTAVAGEATTTVPATLQDHAVCRAADGAAAVLVPQDGASAPGLLWRDLTDAQWNRLTLYQSLGGGDPGCITVTLADGSHLDAHVWPGTAAPDDTPWSLAEWQARCAVTCTMAAEEIFGRTPWPTAADLRWQYPVMLKRAWARVLAGAEARPATLRHDAAPGDVQITDRVPPVGRFFRTQGIDVAHRRFDGGWQGPLAREVFVGVEAAMVLPYDPVRDRVVLVEQLRMGALLRGDRNPWSLEPVAGMIDAFETPEEAALRETFEEAGLTVTLRHVTSFYPSPGNATDYFHSFVGFCDLPELAGYRGGLASEHEDLALHVLTLDDALALVASGEIATGPCVTLLYWLALHRADLQLEFGRSPA